MVSGRRHVGVLLALALTVALGWASSAGAYVYWGNAGGYGLIGRANLDGSAVNQSFITGANYVFGVAVDGGHVYWGNGGGTSAIGRANLDGSAPNQSFIVGEPNYPHGLAVDGAHVYWANKNAGTIGRANLDGSGVDQSFIAHLGTALTDVAVDGAHIYWANLSGGGTCQNPQGPGTIGRANLDGSAVNPGFIAATLPSASTAQGAGGPWGLAVDGAHIYWDNGDFGCYGTTKYAIGRANLDGSGVNLSFIANAGEYRPWGVAVDGAHVYWATGSSYTIARANLDGSAPDLSFIAAGGVPYTLAVDAVTPDTTAPVMSLSGKTIQKAGKFITIVVSCRDEACTAIATGTLNVPGAGAKRFKLGTATKAAAPGGRAVLRLKVPLNARKAITRALRKHKRVTAEITVTARDAAGNAAAKRRTIKLRT